MLLPLTAIAAFFLGSWILAIAIEFKIRSLGKREQKTKLTVPESGVSLISLILFLFNPTHLINSFPARKLESESPQSPD